jgi:hypothetical protein
MRNLESIRKAVTETLSNQFNGIRILEVRVHEDVDSGEDDVLRIDVIFEGASKDLVVFA